jgi:CheY-like chemotaxis protein
MEHARVALFEDHRAYRRVLAMAIMGSGHDVVLQADTLPEALFAITQSKPDSFDVAIVDGNLTAGRGRGIDGAVIASVLRDHFPQVLIIGHSAMDKVRGADVHVSKAELNGFDIIDAHIQGL